MVWCICWERAHFQWSRHKSKYYCWKVEKCVFRLILNTWVWHLTGAHTNKFKAPELLHTWGIQSTLNCNTLGEFKAPWTAMHWDNSKPPELLHTGGIQSTLQCYILGEFKTPWTATHWGNSKQLCGHNCINSSVWPTYVSKMFTFYWTCVSLFRTVERTVRYPLAYCTSPNSDWYCQRLTSRCLLPSVSSLLGS